MDVVTDKQTLQHSHFSLINACFTQWLLFEAINQSIA